MKIKQQATKQPKDKRRNQKISGDKWNGNIIIQNLWDIGKTFLRGRFIAIKPTLGSKKNLKLLKLTPNGTIIRRTNKIQN